MTADVHVSGVFMSMLSRYHKSGGFVQLLQLIETCGKSKQDNFLNMIEGEDSRWAAAIKEKMLTLEKVLSWPEAVLAEIAVRVQPLTLGTAFHGFKPEDKERFLKTFTASQKRVIEDVMKTKVPTPAEMNSAITKMLIEVRTMAKEGYIRFEKFAPEMNIPEDFEDKLGKDGSPTAGGNEASDGPNLEGFGSPAPTAHSSNGSGGGANPAEVNALRSKLHAVATENNQLKTQLKILSDKLAQIKKIA